VGTQIRFWMDAYKNPEKSKEAGRPVFDTVAWCEKRVVGEPDTVSGPVHKMQPDPRVEFAEGWAKFLADNASEGIVGTPLTSVPWLERGDVETLAFAGIKTLEALASVSDGAISSIPGGLALRKKAADMIQAAASSAPLQRLSEENADLRAQVQALQESVRELRAASEGVEPPKRRGRPPKQPEV
jgi:hypothetical protein